jgi:hypothetical protein
MKQAVPKERRVQQDRREKPTRLNGMHLLRGRRRNARRSEDGRNGFYVDLYGRRALIIIATIFILSVIDGYLTLSLVKQGAVEANPIMRFYLNLHPMAFLFVKYTISYISVFLLLIHKNFYILNSSLSVKHALIAILSIYAALILWELILFI